MFKFIFILIIVFAIVLVVFFPIHTIAIGIFLLVLNKIKFKDSPRFFID